MPDEGNLGEAAALAAVALKLPKIWPKNIDLWFTQVEAQFALKNITVDETKFNHVVAVLDEDSAQKVASVISSPPPNNKYEALKTRLTQRCGLSDLERAQLLLHLQGLGDLRPSELLTKMQTIRGKMDLENLFTAIFLEQLPEDVRVNLASSTKPLEDIALDADNMVQCRSTQGFITAVGAKKNKTFCYYHDRFGKKARKCIAPCSFRPSLNEVVGEVAQDSTRENY